MENVDFVFEKCREFSKIVEHFFINFSPFSYMQGSMCRMVLIWIALRCPDPGECFTYSEHMYTMHRKFSTGFWSQSLCRNSHKMIEYSEDWQSFRDLNFKNPLESHFSFNKNCFVGRTVQIRSALHYPDLGEPFTYSERMCTTNRKFSKGLWSQSLHQKLT